MKTTSIETVSRDFSPLYILSLNPLPSHRLLRAESAAVNRKTFVVAAELSAIEILMADVGESDSGENRGGSACINLPLNGFSQVVL